MYKNSETLIENYVDYLIDEQQTIFLTESKLGDFVRNLSVNFKDGLKVVGGLVTGATAGGIVGSIISIYKSKPFGYDFYTKASETAYFIQNEIERLSNPWKTHIRRTMFGSEFEAETYKPIRSYLTYLYKQIDPQHVKAGIAAGILLFSLFLFYKYKKKMNDKKAVEETVKVAKESTKKESNEETRNVMIKAIESFKKSVK